MKEILASIWLLIVSLVWVPMIVWVMWDRD